MSYWNIDNPDKPWGKWDANAKLDIPFDWSEWLTGIGETIASHEIIVEEPLEVISSAETGGVVTAFIKVEDGAEVNIGQKYAVTCRVTTSGLEPRIDDRTVYLKMMRR